jgi:hypothetical protein
MVLSTGDYVGNGEDEDEVEEDYESSSGDSGTLVPSESTDRRFIASSDDKTAYDLSTVPSSLNTSALTLTTADNTELSLITAQCLLLLLLSL